MDVFSSLLKKTKKIILELPSKAVHLSQWEELRKWVMTSSNVVKQLLHTLHIVDHQPFYPPLRSRAPAKPFTARPIIFHFQKHADYIFIRSAF